MLLHALTHREHGARFAGGPQIPDMGSGGGAVFEEVSRIHLRARPRRPIGIRVTVRMLPGRAVRCARVLTERYAAEVAALDVRNSVVRASLSLMNV